MDKACSRWCVLRGYTQTNFDSIFFSCFDATLALCRLYGTANISVQILGIHLHTPPLR